MAKSKRSNRTDHQLRELLQQEEILKKMHKYLNEKIEEQEKTNSVQAEKALHKIRELEQEKIFLEGLNEILSKNDFSLGDLFDVLLREFRTPMVSVSARPHMVSAEYNGKLNDERKRKLMDAKENISSLQQLISSIIDSKKIELGQIAMNMTKTNISKVIKDAISDVDKEARRIDTWIYFSPNDTYVRCDSRRIKQVLVNILNNSLKAVPRRTGEIRITTRDEGKQLIIDIQDNGKGMDENQISKIFSKFYKADMSKTLDDDGVNLGLHICRQIIEAHGGKIWIDSLQNLGTIFHFTLPKEEI